MKRRQRRTLRDVVSSNYHHASLSQMDERPPFSEMGDDDCATSETRALKGPGARAIPVREKKEN